MNEMYGIYSEHDDEMYLMTEKEVWVYLQTRSPLFSNYSVHTDGDTVKLYDIIAGPNGKVDEMDMEEFLKESGKDAGLLIRKMEEAK